MITTRARWLTLLAALLGWMFDGLEMGLFPLVAKDSLSELLAVSKNHDLVDRWFSIVMASFLIGAATGGVVFGWIGDKFGRVRALTFSVLLYSACSGLSAISNEPWHLAMLRFFGAMGMGGEWSLGVALVMEVWAGHSRAWMAAWIGAFGNLGYTICGVIALGLNHSNGMVHELLSACGLVSEAVEILTRGNYWRLLMLIGTAPALLTLLIRLCVPESEKWKHSAGKASHWAGVDVLAVLAGAGFAICMIAANYYPIPRIAKILGTSLAVLLVTCAYLIPVRGYLKRSRAPRDVRRLILSRMLLAAGLSSVALMGTWAGLMWMYRWVDVLPGGNDPDAKPVIQIVSSIGAALGCMGAAWLCTVSNRRSAYSLLCICSIITVVAFYRGNSMYDTVFTVTAGMMGFVTAAFYGWLPLYLPEIFPTAVRATGQGFGYNFGRILAAVGNLLMPMLLAAFNGDYSKACSVVPVVYLAGLVIIYFAPETKGQPLPE